MTPFDYKIVEEAAKELYIRALKILPPDVREALKKASARETQPTAKEIFQTILRNVEVSDQKNMLICQDTGLPIYLVKVGSRFPFDGAKVSAALKEGAKRATLEHPFRGSSTHPVTRVNPQTSVGEGLPIIYWDFVPDSDCLDILMIPKGSGSENMSAMKMFIPADGVRHGTCNGGLQNGLSCDVNGSQAAFGPVSFDCPPASASNISGRRRAASGRRDV